MDRKCKIQQLFDSVKTNHKESASKVLEDAKKEIAIAKQIAHISQPGKKSLIMIEEIIKAVEKDDMKNAKLKYKEAEKGFSGHVIGYLKPKLKEIKEVQELSNPKPVRDKPEKPLTGQRSRDSVTHVSHLGNVKQDELSNQKAVIDKNEKVDEVVELGKLEQLGSKVTTQTKLSDQRSSTRTKDGEFERSKRASLKMRQNNPDIADLSDPNRPTKIAEKFSELYDNEWTEAFEELSKKSRKEEESVEILLGIVTEAYKFCEDVAEKQIKKITKAWNAIFEFGSVDNENKTETPCPCTDNEGEGLIIQYRKKIASLALDKLKEDFSKGKAKSIKSKANLSATLLAFDSYVERVVELTRWMCVQDPPIFLCSPKDESFDKNLYRAYTKTGTQPKFFVWPALRLYKEGGVLMKGVVQFK